MSVTLSKSPDASALGCSKCYCLNLYQDVELRERANEAQERALSAHGIEAIDPVKIRALES